MKNSTGSIIILSYPDTVVRHAYTEFSSKVWPLLGIGGKNKVQAGHAALVLISKETKECLYYDFGRYITSYGNGRVRSKNTDVELEVPINADFKGGILQNTQEILLWLEAHPEKTHGDDRLVAAVNDDVDFDLAFQFIEELQKQGEVPYGAFDKVGTNCARFVTDALINSVTVSKTRRKLKQSYLITPSPIGNVIKGNSTDKIYSVYKQRVETYSNRSILKEYFSCFLNKVDQSVDERGTVLPPQDVIVEKSTWLGGIGSGAWFKIVEKISDIEYRIARFDKKGEQDLDGVYKVNNPDFSLCKDYSFVYPSTCEVCKIEQAGTVFVFERM